MNQQKLSFLRGRSILRLLDFDPSEFQQFLNIAANQKKDMVQGIASFSYEGSSVAIILEKPSLRTRSSFEIGVAQLGLHPLVMADTNSAFSRGESVKDTVMVLERYVSCIVLRTFQHDKLEELKKWARIPIVNALSDDFHPCQGLADALTIIEHKGKLNAVRLAYVGDGSNNMANTYCEMAALGGMHLRIGAPESHQPNLHLLAECEEICKQTGGSVSLFNNAREAVSGVDVVITDTFTSMGASSTDESLGIFDDFQVNDELMAQADSQAIFMHCLPAHRGSEVTDSVMDGSHSRIYDEAENRLHVQRALLSMILSPREASTK